MREATYRLFDINRRFQKWQLDFDKTKFTHSLSILSRFSQEYDKEYSKLPYRLNIFDDLKTDENAHSHLFSRILQYKPALIHFICYINENSSEGFYFSANLITKPIITAEKMRIDILIRESGKYAIIIENKIHGATDQDNQIERYIDKCKDIGYYEEDIYVLYLTKDKYNQTKDNHDTWGRYKSSYKFHKHFLYISYQEHILPWIKDFQREIQSKDILINSAIIQYIDYLNHFLNSKTIYQNMNKELQDFLRAELNLKDDRADNILAIRDKINEFSRLQIQLNELIRKEQKGLFKEWETHLREKYAENENISEIILEYPNDLLRTGVISSYEGKSFAILIEYNYNTIYYGFRIHFASKEINTDLKPKLLSISQSYELKDSNDVSWYAWKHTSFENGLSRITKLIDSTLDIIMQE